MSLSWNNLHSCDKHLGSEGSGKTKSNKYVCSGTSSSYCIHFDGHQESSRNSSSYILNSDGHTSDQREQQRLPPERQGTCWHLTQVHIPNYLPQFECMAQNTLILKLFTPQCTSRMLFLPTSVPAHVSFLFFQMSSFTTFIYINFRNPLEAASNTL